MTIKRHFGRFLAAVFVVIVFVIAVLPMPTAHAAGETYTFIPTFSDKITATGGVFGGNTVTFKQVGGSNSGTYAYGACPTNSAQPAVTYTITGVNLASLSAGQVTQATVNTTGTGAFTPGCTNTPQLAGNITINPPTKVLAGSNAATFSFDASGNVVGTGPAFGGQASGTMTLPLSGASYTNEACSINAPFYIVSYTITNVQPQTGGYSTADIATTTPPSNGPTSCTASAVPTTVNGNQWAHLNGKIVINGTSSSAPNGTGPTTTTGATTSPPICINGGTPDPTTFKCPDGSDPVCSDGSTPDAKTHQCPAVSSSDCGSGALAWIICPVDTALQHAANVLMDFIKSELTIDTGCIFNGQGRCANSEGQANSGAYYDAWNVFRVLGTSLIIIAALVMIASQALGFEFLDAYTIRKTLPRLFVAVIGMSLSWPLMNFIITFFNVLGNDLQNLMYAPFSHLPNHAMLADGLASWSILALVGGMLALGFGTVLFPVLGAGVLALLIAVLILIIRQVAVTLLVIVAPLAIAAYVLPNTKKLWDFWKDNFLGMMVVFPIITMLIAAGQIFSAVGASGSFLQQLVGLVAFFVPFFLIPLAFRMATGLISTITGMVNDRSKGAFDRLRNARNTIASNRHQKLMDGRASGFGRDSRAGNLYRRASMFGREGSFSMTGRGRQRYEQHERKHWQQVAAKALEDDGGFVSGWDDAIVTAAQTGTTRRNFQQRFVENSLARQREEARQSGTAFNEAAARRLATEQAQEAQGRLETSFGGDVGSDSVRLAAAKAAIASNTGLDYGDARQNMAAAMNLLTPLQAAGMVNSSDVATILKSAPGRLDRGGQNGYGQLIGQADRSLERYQRGERGDALVTDADSAQLLDEVVDSVDPRQLGAAHIRGVRAAVPRYAQRVTEASANLDTARAEVTRLEGAGLGGSAEHTAAVAAVGTADRRVKDEARRLMNVYDQLNFMSPDKQDAVAESIMSAGVRDTSFGTGAMMPQRDAVTGDIVRDAAGRVQMTPVLRADGRANEGIGDMITMRELMERARSQAKETPSGSHRVAEGRREYIDRGGTGGYGGADDYEARIRRGDDDPDGG